MRVGLFGGNSNWRGPIWFPVNFARDTQGQRAVFGGQARFQHDPHWPDYLWFYEYFHGDDGAGLGARRIPSQGTAPGAPAAAVAPE